jgi:hypothetical protein
VFVIASYAVTLVETKIVFSRESGYAGGSYAGCHVRARTCESQGMRLIYKAPEESCDLMKLKSFNAELIHGYLYEMGTKFEKFVPPKETDRQFREAETERVSTIETPTVVLSKNDGIILVRKTPIIKCSTNLWTTNYPNLFLSKRDIFGLTRMKVEEIDLAQYFNAKLDFLAYSIQGTQKLLYYDVINRICELKYQSLRNQLAIATKHPELAGAILTEKPGVYGMSAGEVLYFYECKQVYVERRAQTECTQELAVTYLNSSWFMSPFTKKLVRQASAVPCSDMAPPLFQVGEDYWVNFRGDPHGGKPTYLDPQTPIWKIGFINIESKRREGIYTPEQLADAHRAMLFPRTQEFMINQIVSGGTLAHKSPVWRIDRLFDKDFQENMAKKFFSQMWGIFATFLLL